MISAALFTALLEYPGSPVHQLIPNGAARGALVGLAMGLTAIALIYLPWGQPVYRGVSGTSHLACPKLHHGTKQRCIFCGYPGQVKASAAPHSSDADVCKVSRTVTTH